jgi:RNA polymerase sigma factor (sigma-70 family)
VEVKAPRLRHVAGGLDFEQFFQAEYRGLVQTFYVLTADQVEAEELAQEAMARAYERWDRVRTMESPTAYVYRVGVNLNRQRVRHLAVRARRLLTITGQPNSQQSLGVQAEIAEAIASLSKGQREAFLLVEWLGLSAEDAGRILRIEPASVRSRVHRARTGLRDRLSEEGEGPWMT